MKIIKVRSYLFIFSMMAFAISGCLEEIQIETETFESALVVEATITNELKQHEVLLSRTFPLEDEGPSFESGATVIVIAEGQGEILFDEVDPGRYVSSDEFRAQPNVKYQLSILVGGRSYSSKLVQLTTTSQIDNLVADRRTNDQDQDGMAILVNSYDPTGNSRFYRFKYEETYKIVAPHWRMDDTVVLEDFDVFSALKPCDSVGFVPRPIEEKICYATQSSNTIILASTNNLSEDRLVRFPVRFISRDNFIIGHRYSLNVKQFVLSAEAHNYFKVLSRLSGSESLFSQIQPGFVSGNIFSETNQDEKVIGFFDVSSVTEERIFFNFVDFFKGEPLPPYISDCETLAPVEVILSGCPLNGAVRSGRWKYLDLNTFPGDGEGPYLLVPRVCGDCTEIGTPEPPEFWME